MPYLPDKQPGDKEIGNASTSLHEIWTGTLLGGDDVGRDFAFWMLR
jgi:hypothetical protein